MVVSRHGRIVLAQATLATSIIGHSDRQTSQAFSDVALHILLARHLPDFLETLFCLGPAICGSMMERQREQFVAPSIFLGAITALCTNIAQRRKSHEPV